MSGREVMQQPALRARVADGRRRELRALLVMAADAARRSRQSVAKVTRRHTDSKAVRDRLSTLLVAAR